MSQKLGSKVATLNAVRRVGKTSNDIFFDIPVDEMELRLYTSKNEDDFMKFEKVFGFRKYFNSLGGYDNYFYNSTDIVHVASNDKKFISVEVLKSDMAIDSWLNIDLNGNTPRIFMHSTFNGYVEVLPGLHRNAVFFSFVNKK